MMRKALLNTFLWATLLLCFEAGFSSEYDDVQVLKSDAEGITFRYKPGGFSEEEKEIDGEIFHRVRIEKCPLVQTAGMPQLPVRIVILGIPLGSEVKATVLDSDHSDLDGLNIAFAPEIEKWEDPLENKAFYRKNENIHAQDRFYPEENVVMENARFIRDQRIVRLKIFPLQYNPLRKVVRKFDSITVQVDFVGGIKLHQEAVESRAFERVFQNVLLNYESSKNLRRTGSWEAGEMKKLKREPEGWIDPFSFSEKWYKIVVKDDGIYKIGKKELEQAGIRIDDLDPGEIRIFSGGGKELFSDPAAVQLALREIAVFVGGGEDGSFDPDDFILFFGWGVNSWEYDTTLNDYAYYLNHYTAENIYWLALSGSFPGSVKRMQTKDGSLKGADPFVPSRFRSRVHLEEENTLYKSPSGHYADFFNWYWEKTGSATRYVSLSGVIPGDTAEMKVRAIHSLPAITVNGETTAVSETPNWIALAYTTALNSGVNEIQIDFTQDTYFDWYEVEYWRRYAALDNELLFESPDTSGIAEYQISDITSDVLLFDISDRFDVKTIVDFLRVQDSLKFEDQIDLKEKLRYYVAAEDKFKSPEDIFLHEKSYLRDVTHPDNQADFLIVTHPAFHHYLNDFRNFREEYSQLRVRIVNVEEIYDEFSWGLYDPLAIREFLKFAHRYWQPPSPSFCLLVGDGNYDFKNNLYPEAFNWIPPFTADRSVSDENYVYFDRYGYLDSDTSEGGVNMIIGRWTVKTSQQLETILNKVMNHEKSRNFGTWRNLITLVADDEYNGGNNERFHTRDTETLAKSHVPSSFNLKKIYLMEYPFDQLGDKPEAGKDLVQAYNSGSLVINWMGHGNRHQWAHEKVFRRTEDIPQLENIDRLPLVYTASCNIGLFFEPLGEAMSEDLLRADNGGAVAVISATYLVYPDPNAELNYKVFDLLLYDNSLTVGEALFIAKLLRQLEWGPNSNDRQYILLGDPLSQVGVPEMVAKITSISSDTLSALGLVTFDGEVLDRDGDPTDFNGVAQVLAFDSERDKSHQMPNQQSVNYNLPGATIFRGNVQVKNGEFSGGFVVPKDISYGGSSARISVYVHNEATDGAGALDSLVVYGSDTTVIDTTGPAIGVSFLTGSDFQEVNWVEPEAVMKIEISDSNGINLTRELGHGITMVVDEDFQHPVDLTDLFQYYQDKYQRGSVVCPLPCLSKGEHSLEIKAWDNFNNSTLKVAKINVVSAEEVQISDVTNYPNPFSDSTYICYTISGRAEKIRLRIFTLSGRLIKDIESGPAQPGFNFTVWDGKDQEGDRVANGVYIYKILAEGEEKKQMQGYGKAVVMR